MAWDTRTAPVWLGRFQNRFRRQHKADGVRHSRVPGRCTGHLRGVVGNDHAVEMVSLKDRENANHVQITLIDESLAIMRYLARDIAKMNICNLALFAVLI